MPKDEFDPDDPMELCGVGLFTDEDTTEAMTECFIEEFMRLGYNHKQLLALFRNPHYTGLNMVLQNKGDPFVRDRIAETFAKWGRAITWPGGAKNGGGEPAGENPPTGTTSVLQTQAAIAVPSVAIDPMGNVIPEEVLNEAGRSCASSFRGHCTCGKKSEEKVV